MRSCNVVQQEHHDRSVELLQSYNCRYIETNANVMISWALIVNLFFQNTIYFHANFVKPGHNNCFVNWDIVVFRTVVKYNQASSSIF